MNQKIDLVAVFAALDRIPEALKREKRWIAAAAYPDPKHPQKTKKEPVNPHNLYLAKWTETTTWGTFEEAKAAIGKRATIGNNKRLVTGIGFVLGDGWAGIDLDAGPGHDREELNAEAALDFAILGCYRETSNSGDGLHFLGRYAGPTLAGNENKQAGVEIYTAGRWFLMTGKDGAGDPSRDITAGLQALHERYIAAPLAVNKEPAAREEPTPRPEPEEKRKPGRPKKEGRRLTDQEVEDALDYLPAENYLTEWIPVGMALKEDGRPFDLYDRWSEKKGGGKYDGTAATRAKWDSFKRESGNKRTLATVIYRAKNAGWQDPRENERGGGAGDFPLLDEAGAELATVTLALDQKGLPANTMQNFLEILRAAPITAGLRYDLLLNAPVKITAAGKSDRWKGMDNALVRLYIENNYGLSSKDKYDVAFNALLNERKYDPLRAMLDGLPPWDGVERCAHFLTKWGRAQDGQYTRECSRLIFAGGVNRAYIPGCKFDCVVVLCGNQGAGKSTLTEKIAMCKDLYASIKIIDGQKGVEAITGKFIVELEELAALGKTSIEVTKQFVTNTCDHLRRAYAEFEEDYPRRCIFIGTTNKDTFNEDQTGGRRWFPVKLNFIAARDIFPHMAELEEYIKLCWAEMRDRFRAGDSFASPAEDYTIIDQIRAHQSAATAQNEAAVLIRDYIEEHELDQISNSEIWEEALGHSTFDRYNPQKDGAEIREIMTNILHWERGNPVKINNKTVRLWVRPFNPESDI